MTSVLICSKCGSRAAVALAANEQELAKVGMLERQCERCRQTTRWGLAEDYRRIDRRVGERRRGERRSGRPAPPAGERRMGTERRYGEMRRTQRRKGRTRKE